jgi:hypothetical protein
MTTAVKAGMKIPQKMRMKTTPLDNPNLGAHGQGLLP